MRKANAPVTGTDAMEVVGKVGRGEIEPLGAATSKSPDAATPRSGEQASLRDAGRLGSRPSIPDSLAAVVRKAMSLDRAARYASVADLQRDIGAYQGGFATGAEKAGRWKRASLAIKRKWRASGSTSGWARTLVWSQ